MFEKLSLEGMQSGLSWLTILRKREAYRKYFHGFDIDKVAEMTDMDVNRIVTQEDKDPRNLVVRHAGKVQSIIHNAKCIQQLREEELNNDDVSQCEDVFDKFLWSFVNDKPIINRWSGEKIDIRTKTPESEAMSKALKKRGFKFVGPTTCYALMQSSGMVIDHPVGSKEYHAALERLKQRPGGYQFS